MSLDTTTTSTIVTAAVVAGVLPFLVAKSCWRSAAETKNNSDSCYRRAALWRQERALKEAIAKKQAAKNAKKKKPKVKLPEPERFAKKPPSPEDQVLPAEVRELMEAAAQKAPKSELQRQQEAELRRQQDEEYLAALLQDQERERKQEEERQRELRELERERQEQENKQAALNEAKALLGTEPESGGTMVRFVLPSGVKLNRRFAVGDTVGTLKAYLMLHFHENEIEMGRIGLSMRFPRKTYNDDDDELTLEDAGLSPQAVLMVQDLDA